MYIIINIILGKGGSFDEYDYDPLRIDTVWSGRTLQTFRRDLLLPSSGSKNQASKQNAPHHEDGGNTFRNIDKFLLD
jgi:hypothetical protein